MAQLQSRRACNISSARTATVQRPAAASQECIVNAGEWGIRSRLWRPTAYMQSRCVWNAVRSQPRAKFLCWLSCTGQCHVCEFASRLRPTPWPADDLVRMVQYRIECCSWPTCLNQLASEAMPPPYNIHVVQTLFVCVFLLVKAAQQPKQSSGRRRECTIDLICKIPQ